MPSTLDSASPICSGADSRATPSCCRVKISAGRATSAVALGVGQHLVGRGATCSVRIGDHTVCAMHAEIIVGSEGVTIRNLGGGGRTMVRWSNAVAPTPVGDEDVVWLSEQVSLTFTGTGRSCTMD